MQYYCQKNYVIIITDGESTKDRNSILSTAVGDTDGDGREPGGAHEAPYDRDGSDYLDDVAKTLQDADFDPVLKDKQHITTYTVGFTINSPLLERTAQRVEMEGFSIVITPRNSLSRCKRLSMKSLPSRLHT